MPLRGPTELVRAARAQIGVTRIDDGSYQRIAFPDGDVPHRRVPNLVTFLKRHGQALPVGSTGHCRCMPRAARATHQGSPG